MNVHKACKSSWQNVISKVNRSIVFIDDICAENLHWNGGAMALFSGGALDVKEFSSFERCSKSQKKAVFIVGNVLMGKTEQILRDIIQASSLQYVILITTVSPALHTLMKFGQADAEDKAFYYIEDKLLEWMGNVNYTAEVHYQPLVTAPISSQLMVLPKHSKLFPLLPTDLRAMQSQIGETRQSSLDFAHLTSELQIQIKMAAATLNSCMEQLGLSEDVYSLGATSGLIATELAGLPWAKTRRKNTQQKCSLLIVDRTLDIAEPTSHQRDSLLDKVLCSLPHLPGHHNDVCVNMAPVCAVSENDNDVVIVPGCLAHPSDATSSSLLNTLASSKQKEALLEVNRQLVEAASREKLPIKLKPGKVTAEQLHSHIHLFKNKAKSVERHGGLLQIGEAVATALTSDDKKHWDELLVLEQGLLMTLTEESGQSPLLFLTNKLQEDMTRSVNDRFYKIEDIFLLLAHIYSLSEDAKFVGSVQEERDLRKLLVTNIMQTESKFPPFLRELVGEEQLEDGPVRMILQDVFEKLKGLCAARNGMEHFFNIYNEGDALNPCSRKPLLQQVMSALVDPAKPELTDIELKSTGFRDKLKSGFGLFMNVSKPRPSDHPVLIVFIIGGVTCTEAKKITDAVMGPDKTPVIVGSTCLLQASDVLEMLLVQDNLYPKEL